MTTETTAVTADPEVILVLATDDGDLERAAEKMFQKWGRIEGYSKEQIHKALLVWAEKAIIHLLESASEYATSRGPHWGLCYDDFDRALGEPTLTNEEGE